MTVPQPGLDTPRGPDQPPSRGLSLAAVLDGADHAARHAQRLTAETWASGFTPLDAVLGGGLRAGELTLIGGAQGLGKTTFALQAARNVAAAGAHATYVCFEHDEHDLLTRLLGMECGLTAGLEAVDLATLRQLLDQPGSLGVGLHDRLRGYDGAAEAYTSLADYGPRLTLVCARGQRLDLDLVSSFVRSGEHGPVFIDYLQKIPLSGVEVEAERVTRVVETLKDLALSAARPVVAIVAADRDGIGAARTRLSHLRGSAAMAYESDVVLMLNNKFRIVSRKHLMYGTAGGDDYRSHVVCSVEKNRAGESGVDVEFRTDLARGHYVPTGAFVRETLIDDRFCVE